MTRPDVLIAGAGPAGLMAAEVLARGGAQVVVHERMPSPARRLLMAGRGGLNLTHAEPLEDMVGRYGSQAGRLGPLLEAYPPAALRDWAAGLGQETFVGSSRRVFPRSLKASPLVRAWLARLAGLGVELRLRSTWTGWDAQGRPRFQDAEGAEAAWPADALLLALGGASWPRLGADGGWTRRLADAGAPPAAFRPANCGFIADVSPAFADRFAGTPLKAVALRFGDAVVRGELLLTRQGLEGGAVYALSARLRDAIEASGEARVTIDLRPDQPAAELAARLARQDPKASVSTRLRKAMSLSPAAIALVREAGPPPADPVALARRIKSVPVRLVATSGLERAISTAGGVRFEDLDPGLQLRSRPGVWVAGEMIDWEAPTGGYLLQAVFATGVHAARNILERSG
ncbi:MAG: NAD(P)/FAD-dependent oxidoreductase [Phenylobacterium sp.]